MRRRLLQLFAIAVLVLGCVGPGLTVYGPPELAEGTILIDGKPAGTFQKTVREYRWVGWKKMKQELMNAPRSETIAKLPPVQAGKHKLEIVKQGYDPIAITFDYSSGRQEIEIPDEVVKKAGETGWKGSGTESEKGTDVHDTRTTK